MYVMYVQLKEVCSGNHLQSSVREKVSDQNKKLAFKLMYIIVYQNLPIFPSQCSSKQDWSKQLRSISL